MANRISVIIDVLADKASATVRKFRSEVSDTDKAVDKSAKSHKSAMSTIADATIAGYGVTQVVDFAQELMNTGLELEAQAAKAKTVFGQSIGVVQDWAKKNAAAMGLTEASAINAGAGIADLLKPMGFTEEAATKQSVALLDLSGALSAWSGGQRSAEEVSQILTKAMLGEREELKSLGISITEADVQTRLAEKGQQKLTGAALAQAKAVATQELIYEKSTDAQKAWADGSMDATKKANESKAAFQEMQQKLASELLPSLMKLAPVITNAVESLEPLIGVVNGLLGPLADLSEEINSIDWSDPISGGDLAAQKVKELGLVAKGTTKDMVNLLTPTWELGDANKEAAQSTYEFEQKQKSSAETAEHLKKKLEDEKRAIQDVIDTLSDRRSLLGVQEDVQTLDTRLADLQKQYEDGNITAEEYWFGTQNMVLDTEAKVADYLSKLDNVPADVITNITSAIETGDLEHALELINHWASLDGKSITLWTNAKTQADWVSGKTTPIKAGSKFASGTSRAPGGMALVGENGPELVNLPTGASVMPASTTAGMGGGGGITVVVNAPVGANLMEAGRQVADALRQFYQSGGQRVS